MAINNSALLKSASVKIICLALIASWFQSKKANINEEFRPRVSTHPRRSNDHTGPVGEGHVVIVLQTPADGAITHAPLALIQLLQ